MTEILSVQSPVENKGDKKLRFLFAIFVIVLLAIFLWGLFWIFTASGESPIGLGWFLFSFAAGLSMIVLPCTLPLVFVIVPLSMGKGYVKGFSVALAFGLGVAMTLSVYGILAAILGKAIFSLGGAGGSIELVKGIFYVLAGLFSILFALSELGLIKFRLPSYMGAAPAFIQNRKDILKAFMLGLFLGNIGVGCPHPATPIILGQIAITGDIFYGWLLFFVHALGRVIPLLLLAVFGILGVNATKGLLKHKDSIARATAWAMVFVGAFLFTLGAFSHDWWVASGQHTLLEQITQEQYFTSILSERLQVSAPHKHGLEEIEGKTGPGGLPLWLGNWIFVFLMVIPLWWYLWQERKRLDTFAESDRPLKLVLFRQRRWVILLLTILLGLIFIYLLPQKFLSQAGEKDEHEKLMISNSGSVSLHTDPTFIEVGVPVKLLFSLRDEKGKPLQGLQISHERLLHVIIISEDFQVFAHIHTEDLGLITQEMIRDAVLPIGFTFPKTGRYLVLINYLHQDHEGKEQFILDVGDRGQSVISKDLSRVKLFGDEAFRYTVSLDTGTEPLQVNKKIILKYNIEKDGLPVKDLQPYLGGAMHLTIVDVGFTTPMHIHGEIHDPATGMVIHEFSGSERFGPDIEAQVVFPYPGIYQIFGEFKHEGKVVVTSFMVEVGKGENQEIPMKMPHSH
ncbi:hypothetical protein HY061_03080 [Candidatus Azambacteria bacterium]|nr:hypothetical protein [Candidatus Azambacteria bacterium]